MGKQKHKRKMIEEDIENPYSNQLLFLKYGYDDKKTKRCSVVSGTSKKRSGKHGRKKFQDQSKPDSLENLL